MVHPGGLLALRLALRAVAKATLSSLVPAVNSATSSIPSLLKISENMVHPGGFEPPTARFVAEYSIQLSYGCIGKAILLRGYSPGTYDGFANQITTMLLLLRRIWCIREDYSAAPRPTGRCLRNVILPGAGDNFADHKTTSSLLSRRIWCIREDSNLRPLGS